MRNLITLVLVLAVIQPAQAFFWFTGGPVLDYVDLPLTTLKAVENKVKSAEFIKHTVSMLQQVAQLYSTYNNARDLYKSIGRAVDTVSHLESRFGSAFKSWSKPIAWSNVGSSLKRWGIRPSNDGPLGAVNAQLADYNHDVRSFSNSLRAAPRSMSRERAIRNLARGEQVDAKGHMDISAYQESRALNDVADLTGGQMQMQLAMESDVRTQDREALSKIEESLSTAPTDDTEINSLANLQMRNHLALARAKADLDSSGSFAAQAAATSADQTAILSFWNTKLARRDTAAAVQSALQSGR